MWIGSIGSTKDGEMYRTIEMLVEMTGSTEEEIMGALYFLYDSQYSNNDLLKMADLIRNKIASKNRLKKQP